MRTKRLHLWKWIVISFFTLIYSSISFVNHYYFRTYSSDLGLETNALYDYAHFRLNNSTLLQPELKNYLSDHFSLLTIFISPLIYIFGSYTLLIVQIVFILFGGLGVFKFFKHKTNDESFALISMIQFFLMWGIYSALKFDFHHNVLGAMLVPWFIYYFEKKKWPLSILFFVMIIISKENMALWMVFICIALIFMYQKDSTQKKVAAILSLISLIYFYSVIALIIPSIANEGSAYLHFKYEALGNNFTEALTFIIKHPMRTFSLLFDNQTGNAFYNGYKAELYFMILLSGGFVLFRRPAWLIMLLPIFGQKLFNSDPEKWGLDSQYSIEFVPVITLCAFSFIKELKKRYLLGIILIITTLSATIYLMDASISIPYGKENLQFYKAKHFKRDFDVEPVYKALSIIPPQAIVSAQTELVPHLSVRQTIYNFPTVRDAEYIAVLMSDATYPLSKDEFKSTVDLYIHSKEWIPLINTDVIKIFKRKN